MTIAWVPTGASYGGTAEGGFKFTYGTVDYVWWWWSAIGTSRGEEKRDWVKSQGAAQLACVAMLDVWLAKRIERTAKVRRTG